MPRCGRLESTGHDVLYVQGEPEGHGEKQQQQGKAEPMQEGELDSDEIAAQQQGDDHLQVCSHTTIVPLST